MKYLDIKLIETKLREDTSEYTVVVVYIDGEKYQITDILKKHMDSPRFAAAIQKMAKRKFPGKQFKTFYVVGSDGKKVDGYDFEVLSRDEFDPNGVPPKKSDDNTDDKGNVKPEVKPEVEPEVEPEPVTIGGVQTATLKDLADQQNAYADSVDKDRDNKHDETGEPVKRMNDEGKYVDAEGNLLPDQLPDIDLPGGSIGSGEEGESGLSGEQAETAPDIADEIYEAIDGLGTSEGRLLKALERIETRPHLFEIIKQYKEKYKSTMSTDIIADFKYDLGKSQFLIDEVNDVMSKLGYVIYGSKFFTLTWVDTSEIKMNGNYVGYQPKIGWHKGVIISIKGQSFGVSPFKKDGWFGSDVGAKYAMGRVEPRDNPNAPQSPSIISGQISRFTTIEKQFGMQRVKGKWVENLIDNYIEDTINDKGIMPPVKAGDTIDNDIYRMLTFLGDNGVEMLWSMYDEETKEYSKLSQEAADAINNYKGRTE
jgi:hypothetical protein